MALGISGDLRIFTLTHPQQGAARPGAEELHPFEKGPPEPAEPLWGRQPLHGQSTTDFVLPWRATRLYRAHVQRGGGLRSWSKAFVKSLPETQAGGDKQATAKTPQPQLSIQTAPWPCPGPLQFKGSDICLGEIINLLFPFINQAPPGKGP